MAEQDRWESAIARLAEQTRARGVVWTPVPAQKGRCSEGEGVRGVPYATWVLEKHFFVYQYDYRYYTDVDEWSPASDVAIEIVNHEYDLAFRVPQVSSRWDLLEAIRAQTSGADAFLDKFLSDDQSPGKKTGL